MKLIFEIIFITRLKNDTKSCKCRCYFFKTKTVETKLLKQYWKQLYIHKSQDIYLSYEL